MATIDVVSLDSAEDVPTPDAEEKVDAASEASSSFEKNEGIETSRKRGRPAGAKDAKRRKTPVRRKKVEASSASSVSASPVIHEEPIIPEVASPAPIPLQVSPPPQIAPAAPIAPIVAPREPERPLYRHRMDYPEQVSAEENHWDSLIIPMFHHHRRRIY